jgi:hypothetical protein
MTDDRTVTIPLPDPRLGRALDLQFVPSRTLSVIPRRLFDRCLNRVFDVTVVTRIYQLADAIAASPAFLLYVLLEPQKHEIHGFLWATLDVIESGLSVYAFAVDTDYDDGRWVQRASRWLYEQPFPWDSLKPQIGWITNRPEALREAGARPDSVQRLVVTKEMPNIQEDDA